MCPVQYKENGLPMVISVFKDASYALDWKGDIVADLGDGNGGYLVCDMDPHTNKQSSL